MWISHLSWQLWLCRTGIDRKCASAYANVWGDDHHVHPSNTTARSNRAVFSKEKRKKKKKGEACICLGGARVIRAQITFCGHLEEKNLSHVFVIFQLNNHTKQASCAESAGGVNRCVTQCLIEYHYSARRQVGRRAGGEARLGLAASSSLSARRDCFFFLSPRCVAAVGLRCVLWQQRGKTVLTVLLLALPSRLHHAHKVLPGAHHCHLCSMQVGEWKLLHWHHYIFIQSLLQWSYFITCSLVVAWGVLSHSLPCGDLL